SNLSASEVSEMSDREITNAQVLADVMNAVAVERESMRKELQQWFDEELQQWQSRLDEKLQQLRSKQKSELAELAKENAVLAEENRALCAELHEAKTMLNFFRAQRDPEQPPQ